MKVTRRFTQAGASPFDAVEWTTRSSRIANPDGSVVFEMRDAEIPSGWSQLATDIIVSKYFRKAGVPQFENPYAIPGDPDAVARVDERGRPVTGPERSARQVVHRLAGCWRHWGETHGYFDTPADAQAFYDELVHMMLHQMVAPNSPQWFNTGLNWAYGINGPAQGHWIADPATGEVRPAPDAYTHPQPHACFIQSVSDDLVNEGGIMDLWTREARLFKYGSGTGTNFSSIRAENEPLSGGGKSSGLMSFLKIGDRAAGAIKSGGTTRRAAKMVCLDLDHPDIQSFVNWKVREEIKVAALVEGLRVLADERASAGDPETIGETAARIGLRLDYDFNGEAYHTVSGQNSNNSVRIPDAFFDAVDAGGPWTMYFRTPGADGERRVAATVDARSLWDQIGYAAWRCADPGVQYDTTINAWHTCPGAGRINASNPCSEYMFLDDTACNLASLNVLRFYDPSTRTIDAAAFEHAVDLWTVVLEISVLMASFPSRPIAELSWKYRTLGLGYANLGAALMQAGLPYDSDEGRAVCATLSAVLTGASYRRSALLASEHGPFAGFGAERENMLRVIRNHRLAAHGEDRSSGSYEGLRIRPVPIDHALVASLEAPRVANLSELASRARAAWDEALELGERHGYRNAQVTVIAPTGTIGLLMDCDTTGVEPDFALVKFKKLAGGGYFKIANASVRPALAALGYAEDEVRDILTWIMGSLDLDVPVPAGAPGAREGMSFAQWLRGCGMLEEDLDRVRAALPGVFELRFAFGAWTLGDEALERLGLDPAAARSDPSFDVLAHLGLDPDDIQALNTAICGTQTVEGAPHLRDEHLPVFDCASPCGRTGTRFIAPEGHIRMMAAAQPFISGAISKTINLPPSATVEDINAAYRMSWELGLKANALYRDGCKLSQPLSTSSSSRSEAKAASNRAAEAEELARDDADPIDAGNALSEAADAAAGVAAAAAEADAARAASIGRELEHRPLRRRLPQTRASLTHKFSIAGHEGYLTVGLYADGKPGELFITMAKEGSTIGGLMDSLGTATSVALQYGVPIESLVKKFTHQRFEPAGITANPDIPIAKSLVDYIFRWMGMEFIEGYRERVSPRAAMERERPAHADTLDGPATREGDHAWPRRMEARLATPHRFGLSDAPNGHAPNGAAPNGQTPDPEPRDRITPNGHAPNGREMTPDPSGTMAHGTTPSSPAARRMRQDGTAGGGAPIDRNRTASHTPARPDERATPGNGSPTAHANGAGSHATTSASVGIVGSVWSDEDGAEHIALHTVVAPDESTLSRALDAAGDAPPCDVCGTITVRSGTCYKCLNCGSSLGCS